jgi:hypothetical protein
MAVILSGTQSKDRVGGAGGRKGRPRLPADFPDPSTPHRTAFARAALRCQ